MSSRCRIHADYRCRHSGACCSADWDVPIELPVYRTLQEAVDSGRLRPQASARHLPPFMVEPDLPEGAAAMLERPRPANACFSSADTKLCIVHRDLGEASLPATCRYFPRLAVRDDRGTFITLSHFCPTAASMLFRDDCPLAIVAGPHAFRPAEYEGLIVTGNDLPPLLSPTMLMDPAGYSAWERHMVARCAEIDWSPEVVVAHASARCAVAAHLEARQCDARQEQSEIFPPTSGTCRVPTDARSEPALGTAQVMQAVPDDLRPQPDEHGLEKAFADDVRPAWSTFPDPAQPLPRRQGFASWTAYQGRGVATIVRGLDAALAVVRLEAARQCRNAGRAPRCRFAARGVSKRRFHPQPPGGRRGPGRRLVGKPNPDRPNSRSCISADWRDVPVNPFGPSAEGLRVLVAEDDPVSRHRLHAALRSWGYEVTSVVDGQEALREIGRRRSGRHIAILDWSMPKVDGIQVCRAVRETAAGQYVYMILLTSHERRRRCARGIRRGRGRLRHEAVRHTSAEGTCSFWRARRPAPAAAHRRARATPREGDARSADRAPHPRRVLRNLRRRDRARASSGTAASADDGRPRSLQERQRPLRPSGRRRRAAGSGGELKATFRKGDAVGRYGGEEFVALALAASDGRRPRIGGAVAAEHLS